MLERQSARRVFTSVFSVATQASIPTPSVTPLLGSAKPQESFESDWSDVEVEDRVAVQIRWNRAWHVATTFLSLPNGSLSSLSWIKPWTAESKSAFLYLLQGSHQHPLRSNSKDDIIDWYISNVTKHFNSCVIPQILQLLRTAKGTDILSSVLRILRISHTFYVHPLHHYIFPLFDDVANLRSSLSRLQSQLHAFTVFAIPHKVYVDLLSHYLKKKCEPLLCPDVTPNEAIDYNEGTIVESEPWTSLLEMMQGLHEVGLGGAPAQRVFAEVMSQIFEDHVNLTYAGLWTTPSNAMKTLNDWIEKRFVRCVSKVLQCLKTAGDHNFAVSETDVAKWKEMGVNRLGALRTKELFDVIINWDQGTVGAIDDLKTYVSIGSHARMHLVNHFSNTVSHRLLQPGASTLEVLQVYIASIRAFTLLEPKGVLLDRVARPIRRYLRERDDTVNIIVRGLLADTQEDSSDGDVLEELAIELTKDQGILGANAGDDCELDYDDMSWMPDPVDAGPDFKKSKHSDVMGSVLSLFENKDTIVKEFQKVMGERLLTQQQDFDREISVLELLKLRYGEAQLQACEVMLRDILDSRRVDSVIREDKLLGVGDQYKPAPELHSKILSHLFWPSLQSESFDVPAEITSLQARYSEGFESIKQTRKLTWLQALGQVTVELDLEDRVVTEDVQTWQASVIYAFQDTGGGGGLTTTRTVADLAERLHMSEDLVRNALTFWVGKLVIKEIRKDTYNVLETLSDDEIGVGGTAQAAIAAVADAATSTPAPAMRSEQDMAKEKMGVLWQFVVGMLTNQGSMPLQRIVMMLKFVVPGEFSFANEQIKEFLDDMVGDGKLELAGGNYKIVH